MMSCWLLAFGLMTDDVPAEAWGTRSTAARRVVDGRCCSGSSTVPS